MSSTRLGLLGLLAVVLLVLGLSAGAGVAVLLAVPPSVGSLVGGVAGFLVAGAVLRRAFVDAD